MQVSPKQLEFEPPFTESATKTITITNNSENNTSIAFKVKTTAPKLYCVRPNASIVAPGQSMDVSIIFQGLSKEPSIGSKCKDKFLIVSVPCSSDLNPKAISNIWPELQKQAGQTADVKLKVVYNFSSLVNPIAEESSQSLRTDKPEAAAAVGGAAVAGGAGASSFTPSKATKSNVASNKEKAAVDTSFSKLAPSTTNTTTGTGVAATSRAEQGSVNIYILAAVFVLIAYLLARFLL